MFDAEHPTGCGQMQALSSDYGLRRLALTAVGVRRARDALDVRRGQLLWDELTDHQHQRLRVLATELDHRQVRMLLPVDPDWPRPLSSLPSPPPYLFVWGSTRLLEAPTVGMCGSRHASARGLEAARACGREAARHGMNVVSGYAKGVDTETHLAALEAGAGTVIVLAEGIMHFRRKRAFDGVGFNPDRVLVLSQFPPSQRWNAGAAMTRNGVICALGTALVVVEAGERGGTLNAGRQALDLGRQVLALQFGDDAPAGNLSLFAEGARRIATTGQLSRALRELKPATAW
jgi:DNA processing protein